MSSQATFQPNTRTPAARFSGAAARFGRQIAGAARDALQRALWLLHQSSRRKAAELLHRYRALDQSGRQS